MVPAVAGVLAQPLDELGEALAVGVEVVLERLLQHQVHDLEVLRDRDAVLVPRHAAHRHALAQRREGTRAGSTGRVMCSQRRRHA